MTETPDAPNVPAPESTATEVPAPAASAATAPQPSGRSGSGSGSTLTAEGRERPHFLLEFPDDPALQQLVRAFEAGNYQAVRQGAPKLAESSEDAIVRAAARELVRRIEPDPLMKYLLFVALGLFVFVVWYTYQGQH
ncbi:MAG TPA: hypothetical protein VFK05_38945 [Polyangiaceae bacterium]|nr:hypothetical protein [Polyangiaceae bacterium]